MSESPEHIFITKSLDETLSRFSESRLLGVQEVQRRTFDYGCILLRDFSRPLISQVLWGHHEGIEKDIRTLLFEGGASLKLFFLRDNVRNRARLEEILRDYRRNKKTAPLMRGLRVIAVPYDFDADSESQRKWMRQFLIERVSSDLLFGVIFGKLNSSDVATFSDHGGPHGLKYAALHLVTTSGRFHGPTFERELGYRGPALREVITMLGAINLIGQVQHSITRLPTLKGRFLLDLSRRILFEYSYRSHWSDELQLILHYLRLELPDHGERFQFSTTLSNVVSELLRSMSGCKSQFGIDLLKDVKASDPKFYSEFEWKKFVAEDPHINASFWSDSDDIDLFRSAN